MLILATGTSGTIGKHLSNRVRPVPADLMSFESITNSLENFNKNRDSSLIHLAGVVGKIEVEKNVAHSRKINIHGTEILAENFKKNFSGKFYYISTSHVYVFSIYLFTSLTLYTVDVKLYYLYTYTVSTINIYNSYSSLQESAYNYVPTSLSMHRTLQ
jgi:nucleoside-diphosphate-sugar epimerase